MHRICLLISLGLACGAQAMIPVGDLIQPTVRFFRSPSSQFHSGEAALEVLQEKEISSRLETWYWVSTGKHKEWVPAQNLFYLRDFYQQTPSEQTGFLKAKVPVLRFKKGWRPAGKLKAGTTLSITSVRTDWSCGSDAESQVCVPTDKLLLAIDAAKKVQDSEGKWHSVKFRKGSQMLLSTGQLLPIASIKAWEAHTNLAFIRPIPRGTEAHYHPPANAPAFSKVILLKQQIRRWHQSIMPAHGNVWWQTPDRTQAGPGIILTHDELQGRRIFDGTPILKTINKNFSEGLLRPAIVSADGVFLSRDGETWSLLEQFGETNHPVAFGPRKSLVVGDQISFDEGRTFQNYLRWDHIALLSQKILNHAPRHLRLQRIRSLGQASLEVHIDTGYKILAFEFNTINNQLKFLRSRLKR